MILYSIDALPQDPSMDSLKHELEKRQPDTTLVKLLYTLSFRNAGVNADTAFMYSHRALVLAEKIGYVDGIFWSELTLSASLAVLGNYPLALEHGLEALSQAKVNAKILQLAYANGNLSECYFFMGEYDNSLMYESACVAVVEQSANQAEMYFLWIQLSRIFEATGKLDSALFYSRKAYSKIKSIQHPYAECVLSPVIGNAYAMKGAYDSALFHYRRGVSLSIELNTETDLIDNYNGMAKVFVAVGHVDSSLHYLQRVVSRKIAKSYPTGLLKAATLLAEIYGPRRQADSTLKYLRLGMAIKDTLYNREKTIAVQTLIFKEQENMRKVAALKEKWQNQVIAYVSVTFVVLMIITAGAMLRSHRRKQLQRMRNSIADDLHDEMGSTLSSIGIMSELAKTKSPESVSILNSISESATTIQENMSDIWAEDNKKLRESLCQLIDSADGMLCSGTFSDATRLMQNVAQAEPNVIMMDINMPGTSGIEAVVILNEKRPDIQILMQTVFEDDDKIFAAICAGASGYMLKKTPPQKMIEAVRETYAGGSPMTASVAAKVLKMFRLQSGLPKSEFVNLSTREKQILGLLVSGKSYKVVAAACFISIDTVGTHIRHIYEKLHVHSKSEAVAKAILQKLV